MNHFQIHSLKAISILFTICHFIMGQGGQTKPSPLEIICVNAGWLWGLEPSIVF